MLSSLFKGNGLKGEKMKELDVVKLKSDFENIQAGTKGSIVLDYDKKYCEVEFVDDDGNTIDVITIPKELLELVWEFEE